MIAKTKFLGIATVLIMLLASLASISPRVYAQPRYGGTLVIGLSSEPTHLVLCGPPTWAFYQVANQIGNSLICFDPETLEWKPDLAESWNVTTEPGGGMSIRFNLVKNATWHDGQPFTSADVKYTYTTISPLYNSFIDSMMKNYVTAIETPDNYTVIFRFNTTWAPAFYPGYFGGSGICIMPKHLYEGTDIQNNPYNTKPVGTGPFKFKEWKKGEYIVLERNENYWKGGLPYLDKIIYKIIPSSSMMSLAFETGEIDFVWVYGLAMSDAVSLQERIGRGELVGKRVWFFPSPGASLDVVGFNLHEEGPAFFKNVKVRKAIAAAIDRSKIAEVVYYGRVEALETCVSHAPATLMYYPDKKQPAYNVTEAERLLDEAGYPRGPDGKRAISFRITVDSVAYPWYLKEAELIRDFLAEVGITVEVVALETAAWHEKVFKNWDFDMSIFPFVHGPGPAYLIRYYTARGIARASWSNAMGYSNPEYEQLVYAAEKEINRTREIELMKQALNILVEDQPAVWTCSRTFAAAVDLDFSDEYQPGVWENGFGTGYMRVEKVYWLKAPPPTQPGQTVEVPYVPDWVYVVVAVCVVVTAGSIVYAVRKGKKK
ncbi:MAG: ABC transporter substrate-binding protein [Candidatus Bathyarchaeia archaeon]